MTFEVLPWHQPIWTRLCARHARDRLPHAILLHGPGGCGKRLLAEAIAGLLLCQRAGAQGYCGQCRGCELWRHGSHTDYLTVAPEAEGKVLPVDQIRAASHFLEASGRLASGRVVIICPAEAMQGSASNALLKTLEEPPANAHLILVSSLPSVLLATLRSRCEKLLVPAPGRQAALGWLQQSGHQAEIALEALELAGGAPILAQRWLADGQLAQRREWRSQLGQLLRDELNAVEVAEGWLPGKADEPGRLQELVSCLQRWACDEIRAQATKPGGLRAPALAARLRLIEQLGTARRALQSAANPNPQLLLEDLLLEWQQAGSAA